MASDVEINEQLQGILRSDEFDETFQDRTMEMLRSWFVALQNVLDRLGFWPRMALLTVCLILLAVIAFQVVVAVRRANLPAMHRAAILAGGGRAGVSADILLQRARALADAEQIRDAARALQQAVLVHMCHERNVAWQAARADWEWIPLLAPPKRAVAFMQAAQRLAFGPQPARAGYDACAREAEALLAADTRTMQEPPA